MENPEKVLSNGYLLIYLNNRSTVDVFFDKVSIKIQKGNLVEEDHYYPHGLPMAKMGDAALDMEPNRLKHQGKEYITELGLNWMDFHARQYDPQVGRFLGVDPLAAVGGQDRYSPFAAMGNQPESMVDPDGRRIYQFEQAGGAGAAYEDFGSINEGNIARTKSELNSSVFTNGWMAGGGSAYLQDWLDKQNILSLNEMIGMANRNVGRVHFLQNGQYVDAVDDVYFEGFDPYGNVKYSYENARHAVSYGLELSTILNLNVYGGQQQNGGELSLAFLGPLNIGLDIAGGASEAYGLSKQSLWQSRYGWKSGYTTPLSRWITFGKAAGNASTFLGGISLAKDTVDVYQGKMSWGRFGYHLAGFGTSVYVGAQFGGPYGAAAGVGFGVTELGYDHVIEPYVVEPARQEFNRGFNSWLLGVYKGMGIPGF